MSIHYVVQARANLKNPASGPKYHPVSKSLKPLDRDFLIKDMVNNTSLTYQEAASGIDYLFKAIPKYLSLGFTVQIGRMGYFRITFRTEPSDTPEEVTTDKIKRIKLSFVCGPDIRKTVNEFSVEKYPEKTGV